MGVVTGGWENLEGKKIKCRKEIPKILKVTELRMLSQNKPNPMHH